MDSVRITTVGMSQPSRAHVSYVERLGEPGVVHPSIRRDGAAPRGLEDAWLLSGTVDAAALREAVDWLTTGVRPAAAPPRLAYGDALVELTRGGEHTTYVGRGLEVPHAIRGIATLLRHPLH